MKTTDDATLFTCADPPSARPFLRRLRARERRKLFFILVLVALTLVVSSMHGSIDIKVLLTVLMFFGTMGIMVCLAIALAMHIFFRKIHTFQNHAAILYIGGIFTVCDTVRAKSVKTLQISPVSFAGAQFHLILVIYKHLSDASVGGMNVGGTYPIYFAVENSDVNRIVQWARQRNIDVAEGVRITSPGKLPLFIR